MRVCALLNLTAICLTQGIRFFGDNKFAGNYLAIFEVARS